MSWKIHCTKNTVSIPSSSLTEAFVAQMLADGCDFDWQDRSSFALPSKGNFTLQFNPEHMEHMDWLSYKELRTLVARAGAQGEVCFTSFEGDNHHQKWRYVFEGGKCRRYRTHLVGSRRRPV